MSEFEFKSIRKDAAAYMKLFAERDQLGALLGGKMISLNHEECVYEYTASPAHYNPNKILHGGALYSVMDSSQGAFVHFILEPKFSCAATGTATIRYEAPVREGVIQIRTWLKSQEGRKLFVSSEARAKGGGVVATLEEVWIAII